MVFPFFFLYDAGANKNEARWKFYLEQTGDIVLNDGYKDPAYSEGLKFSDTFHSNANMQAGNKYNVYLAADDTNLNLFYEFIDPQIRGKDSNAGHLDGLHFRIGFDGSPNVPSAATTSPLQAMTGPITNGTFTKNNIECTYSISYTKVGYNIEISIPRTAMPKDLFSYVGIASMLWYDSNNVKKQTYAYTNSAYGKTGDASWSTYANQIEIVDRLPAIETADVSDLYTNIGDPVAGSSVNIANIPTTKASGYDNYTAYKSPIVLDGYKDDTYANAAHFYGDLADSVAFTGQTGFDAYVAYGADGLIYMYVDVYDDFVAVPDALWNKTNYHTDCFDIYVWHGASNNNRSIYNVSAPENGVYNRVPGGIKEQPISVEKRLTPTGWAFEMTIKYDDKATLAGGETIGIQFFYNNLYYYTSISSYGKYTVTNPNQSYPGTYMNPNSAGDAGYAAMNRVTFNAGAAPTNNNVSIFNGMKSNKENVAIVYPKDTTEFVKNLITWPSGNASDTNLRPLSKYELAGAAVLQEGDEKISEYTYKVLVGHVSSFAETRAMIDMIGYDSYGVGVFGNTVSIIGPTEQTLAKAVQVFKDQFNGTLTAKPLYSGKAPAVAGSGLTWLNGTRVVSDSGFGNYQIVKSTNVTYDDFIAISNGLLANGYQLYSSNIMGGKYYSRTFYNNTEIVTVNFGKHYAQYFDLTDGNTVKFTTENMSDLHDSLRINVASRAIYSLPVMEIGDYEVKAETAFVQVGQSDAGLCDIVRLEDGRFIIFDSKQNWSYYKVYQTLLSLNNGEKPVVAAWFFTHFHQDHNGGFSELMKQDNISELIEIQNVIFNLGSEQVYGTSFVASGTDKANMEAFATYLENSGANLIFGTTGQVFTFANASVEILLTYSDSMPMNIVTDNTNRTNSIYSLSIRKASGTASEKYVVQKFMITGDSSAEQHNLANLRYGDYLKSDFLQLSHHGGGEYRNHNSTAGTGAGYLASYNFYKTVNPTHILIPGTNGNASGSAEKQITKDVKENGGQVFYYQLIVGDAKSDSMLKVYSNTVISIPYGISELSFPTLPIDPTEYTNTVTGTLNSDTLNGGKNPNGSITTPYGFAENGSYLYVGKTAYVDNIPVDGVMEDIYTYGIHLKNDRGATGKAEVQSNYDIYMVFDQNGKLHVFYDVYDPNWHVYKGMASGYRQDGIDFYFGFGTPGTVESNSFRIKAVVEDGANTIDVQNAYNTSGGKSLDVLEKFAVVVESNDPSYATPTKGKAVHYTVEFVFNHVFAEGELFSFWAGSQNLKAVIPADNDKDVQTNGHDNIMTESIVSHEQSAYVGPTAGRNNVIVVSKAPATNTNDDHAHDYVKETDKAPVISDILPTKDAMMHKVSGIGKVYTIPATDGQWDNIYSYGYKISGDYSGEGNPNKGGFDAYLVYAADGKIHVFIKVVDNTKPANNESGYLPTDGLYYHGDSLDVFVNSKFIPSGRTGYAFQAMTGTQDKGTQPEDYKVVMTEEGYNVEFSFDNNGSPYRIGDVFTFDIYMNDVDMSDGYKKSSITNATYWLSDIYHAYGKYFAPECRYSDAVQIISTNPITVNKCDTHTFGDDSVCDLCGCTCEHNYVPVVTPPTCNDDGYTTHTCSICGDSYVSDPTTAHGHTFGDVEYTWNADNTECTATRVCTHDETHVETETVTATSKVTDATCTKNGSITYTATFTNSAFETQTKDVAGETAHGHAFGEVTYTWSDDNTTCTATRVCTHDETHVETETVTATSKVTDATCDDDGYTTYTATFTNTAFAPQIKEVAGETAYGHAFGEVTYTWSDDNTTCTATRVCTHDETHVETETVTTTSKVTDATCDDDGYTTYTATFTNPAFEAQTKDVAGETAHGHAFGNVEYTWNADNTECTATRVCTHDETHVETETVTATSEVTDATCTKNGSITYTATFTNPVFKAQTKVVAGDPKHGHKYGAVTYHWNDDYTQCIAVRECIHEDHSDTESATIISQTTGGDCVTPGKITYMAIFANAAFSTQIKILPMPTGAHSFKDNVCENCQTKAPTFTGASLALHSDISLYFKVKATVLTDEYTFVKVVFVDEAGEEYVITELPAAVDGVYTFAYDNVLPKTMGDIVSATLYTKYGDTELVGETVEYSAAQYCYDQLKVIGNNTDDASKALRTLLVDLLNYGAADQIYAKYKTDSLINANLTEEQKNYATSETPTVDNNLKLENNSADNDVVWKSAGLNFDHSIVLRIAFSAKENLDLNGIYVRMTLKNNESVTWTSSDFQAVYNKDDNRYYVYFDGLNPAQIRDEVCFVAYDAEGNAISGELTYSVVSYLARNLDTVNARLADLLIKMVKYGDSVAAYVAAN